MSRNEEYQFIPTDAAEVERYLTELYEGLCKIKVRQATPEWLYIKWVTEIIIQERILNNYTGNQNIPSRAAGENLDALAELVLEQKRPGAKPSGCTVRFYISEPQPTAILIPAGTRVTDTKTRLVWETEADAYVDAGESFVDVHVCCQVVGTAGNGYIPGTINTLVDIYDYYSECANISETEGGSDIATDQEFYELMRESMDGYSCAGSLGGYIYFAKRVSTEIADVVPNSPLPGVVYIYVLMKDGRPAGEEMKNKVFRECSGDKVRAFTDYVNMGDPELIPYDIDFTYYIAENSTVSAAQIQNGVNLAVSNFVKWQSARLGRDINPSKLHSLLMQAGVKRIDIRAPVFTSLRDGRMVGTTKDIQTTVPQIGEIRNISVLNGGYEDE